MLKSLKDLQGSRKQQQGGKRKRSEMHRHWIVVDIGCMAGRRHICLVLVGGLALTFVVRVASPEMSSLLFLFLVLFGGRFQQFPRACAATWRRGVRDVSMRDQHMIYIMH